jgi:pimeloyl-ACP methyl ester carboxylesterase
MRVSAGDAGHTVAIGYVELPGDGPLHVYVAGLGSAATAMYPEAVLDPVLGGRWSVLVDLAGTGWSDLADPKSGFGYTIEEHADTIAALVDRLGERGCVVVGHSLGGAVAISLAHRRPELVGRLVVAEPNLDPGVGQISGHIAGQPEQAFVERGYAALLALLDTDTNAGAEPSVWRATLRHWDPRALHKASVSLLADRTPTFREQLTAATMPRAYIRGERTDTPESLDGLEAAGVRLLNVPKAGHPMVDENPAGFAAALAEALR